MVGELSLPHHCCFRQIFWAKEAVMGKLFSVVAGVVAGFVVAHFVNQTSSGSQFFARANATVQTFLSGLRDGYRG